MSKNISSEEVKIVLEEWKVVIQTQMHFNEMIMKMRTTAVSVVLTIFGAAAYSLQHPNLNLNIRSQNFHASVLIVFLGVAMLCSVFILDYCYYNKMLIGAVKRSYEIDSYGKNGLNGNKIFGMSSMIRDEIGKPGKSKYYIFWFYGIIFIMGIVFIGAILFGFAPS